MFEVLSSEIVKMPEVNPNDRTYTSKQRNAKSKSPDQQHKENHSFTGWTNVDSLNGSQIAQETQRNANIIIVPNKVIEILPKNLPEKTREVSIEPPTMQDLKRKLWIDVTREKPYEESLRSYPKIGGDNYPRFSRVSSVNRVSTALTPQRTELNVISIHYASSKSRQSPLGFATSPRLQQLRSTKQNSPHPSQGVQNSESIQQLKSNSKTLDINTSSEVPATIKDFSLFRALALTPNPEKRAVTALKKRHSEGLSSPITVVGVGKGIKIEDTKKTKSLKLSKALSLWSHVTSPAIVNSVNNVNTVKTIKTQPDEGGVKSTNVLSLEATESSTSGKNPGNPIPTKMLNFTGGGGNEIKYLVPLPHFKPTIKVKRPADAEKNEADTKMFTKTEAVKMRVTSPVNLYTKDWDTLNGFPRKVSREVVHKSELKRRPFDEAYGDDYRPSETLNINTSSNSEAKETGNNQSRKDSLFQKIAERRSNTIVFESRPRTKEHSLESKQEILIVNKAPGISVVKIIGKIAIDEKKAKKHQKRLSKGMRTSESPDSSKESVEKKQEPNKTREVKNFKLF